MELELPVKTPLNRKTLSVKVHEVHDNPKGECRHGNGVMKEGRTLSISMLRGMCASVRFTIWFDRGPAGQLARW